MDEILKCDPGESIQMNAIEQYFPSCETIPYFVNKPLPAAGILEGAAKRLSEKMNIFGREAKLRGQL